MPNKEPPIIQFPPAGLHSGADDVQLWFEFSTKKFSPLKDERKWDPVAGSGGGVGPAEVKLVLPAPPNLASDQKNNYSIKQTSATYFINAFGDDSTFANLLGEQEIGEAILRQLGLISGAEARAGAGITDFTDTVFESTPGRQFSFKYVMIAKTMEEARVITNICQQFKLFSLPTATYFRGRIEVPNFWTWRVLDYDYKALSQFEQSTWTDDAQISILSNVSIDRTGAAGITPISEATTDSEGNVTGTTILPIVTTLNLSFIEVEPLVKIAESRKIVNRSSGFDTQYDPATVRDIFRGQ